MNETPRTDKIAAEKITGSKFSVEHLVELLEQSHNHLLEFTLDLPDSLLRKQFHADLSPLGWHLGHTAFIERYWIDEVLLGNYQQTRPLHDLYFPERNDKAGRTDALPVKDELLHFVQSSFSDTLKKLPVLMKEEPDDPLLKNGYLALFLIQHNYQHRETMMQILQQMALLDRPQLEHVDGLVARPPVQPSIRIDAGEFRIGATDPILAYDNEVPTHPVKLPGYRICAAPVSNAEFLYFMNSGGYYDASLWSQEGWTWQQVARANAPYHWRETDSGQWYAVTPFGTSRLIADDAVIGINYYEAEAFARFAGCRLPHETEWETAVTASGFRSGKAWEWCRNSFYPYTGYKPFPYDNYSQPWFDGNHITLRGGSAYTHTLLKRASFRNFYTPEKRHVFAGLRLARSS